MGNILGKMIKNHSGTEVFEKVEALRTLAKEWRQAGAGRNPKDEKEANQFFSSMCSIASSLTPGELVVISRAFTHFCAITNAATYHHRSRYEKEFLSSSGTGVGALSTQPDSCGGVIPNLLQSNKCTADEIYETLTSQCVELVLTAHPTEVNRRTLLNKHMRIQEVLTEADHLRNAAGGMEDGITPYQKSLIDSTLEREIGLIWQSDELSREKPSPQSEAERGTMVVETVLWNALPQFLRKLDATMISELGKGDAQYGLPLTAAPIKFSSWMGGDRDGNPNVTPRVTREVCLMNRIRAAKLIHADLLEIRNRLSTTYCNDELRAKVGEDARAPYRRYLTQIIQKIELTSDWAKQQLSILQKGTTDGPSFSSFQNINVKDIYLDKNELLQEMLLVHKSLVDTNNSLTGNGLVLDLIRNISAFGLTLVTLDVRQESTRHMEALDAITRYLGLGSYSQWDEVTKLSWLQKELSSKRPLLRPGDWHSHPDIFSSTVVDTLETFHMIADQHDDSLGAYVISQATSASDVLAVLLLQRDAGVKRSLRVVPLFETLDDLRGAADTMDTLFSLPAYKGSIDGKQEVMIGYSDSAKDAGRLAASWAQYETQEILAEIATKHDIDLTFFHGKGGTVGRGGNPATFKAVLSHPPNTIHGKFRVTEQGEMIHQNFGHENRAERTMNIFTAAVCAERFMDRPKPSSEWRELMQTLSEKSCEVYRSIVREDDRFVPYFRAATPELELSELNIGSRPAKRKATGGVESLRAIPWIFAWTQTRLNLPIWLGVGQAIQTLLSNETEHMKLRNMYKEFGSFRTTIDLVEMVLVNSEPAIASHYESMLVSEDKAKELGMEVRRMLSDTESAVLDLVEHDRLCEHDPPIQRSLQLRNPYVDCLNVLQAETLKRLRSADLKEAEENVLKNALLISITGIANGMGNTG